MFSCEFCENFKNTFFIEHPLWLLQIRVFYYWPRNGLKLYCAIYLWYRFDISSHPEVFLGKGILKMCSKCTGKHPCRSAISIKFEITLRHACSPVNLLHIFWTPFLENICFWFELGPKLSGNSEISAMFQQRHASIGDISVSRNTNSMNESCCRDYFYWNHVFFV